MRFGLGEGLVRRLRLASEILGWQVVTKAVSVFAFAHAAKCLGPEKFGISGVVLSAAWPVMAVSSLLNEAFLSRRYRRANSHASRQRLITAAASGRLVLAIIASFVGLIAGFAFAPSDVWWFPLAMAAPLLFFVFLQPNWLLVGQDATNVVWRSAGIGSLAASVFLFTLRPDAGPAGIDIAALAVGAAVTSGMGWFGGLRSDGGFKLRFSAKHVRLAAFIAVKSRWLFLTYLFSNIYLYLDTFLLGVIGGAEDAGVYRPAANLATSFYQSAAFIPLLLYPKLLDWAQTPALLWKRQLQLGGVLLAMVAAGAGVAALFSELVFQMLYGPSYVAASGPFVLLITARGIAIASSVFTWGLISSDKDFAVGMMLLTTAVVTVLANLVLIPVCGIWGPAIAALAGDLTLLAIAAAASWNRFQKAVEQG